MKKKKNYEQKNLLKNWLKKDVVIEEEKNMQQNGGTFCTFREGWVQGLVGP